VSARWPSSSISARGGSGARSGPDRLDVVRCHEPAPGEQRQRARRAHQRQAAARPRAHSDAGPGAGRPREPHRVLAHPLVDEHRGRRGLDLEYAGGVGDGRYRRDVQRVADLALRDAPHQPTSLLGTG
jgi:hypothetical protein